MDLATFIQNLITEGKVSVKGVLISFTQNDIQQTKILLQQYYQEDILEMPYIPPAFSEEAALWASQYFYLAVQLTVLRDTGEEIIKEQLKGFPEDITPESIYSADLILRYLPALFELARGLAPADILVKELRKVATEWPFSSVGIVVDETLNDTIIFSHPSLKQEYIDRIIAEKDKRRINTPKIRDYVLEATGEYISDIWPDFETV